MLACNADHLCDLTIDFFVPADTLSTTAAQRVNRLVVSAHMEGAARTGMRGQWNVVTGSRMLLQRVVDMRTVTV